MSAALQTVPADPAAVVAELRAALGDDRVVTDPASLPALATTRPSGRRSARRVAVVRAASDRRGAGRRRAPAAPHGVPVVAARRRHRAVRRGERGRRLRRARPLDADEPRSSRSTRSSGSPSSSPASSTTTCGPPCAEHGLWYPPDPASSPWSTIGGNVATNAGGVCCVKYGVTRDYVLELRGRHRHRRASSGSAGAPPRASAGYDLAGLMVGSEGTLGIVTEVTVRLRPLPAAARSRWRATSTRSSTPGAAVARGRPRPGSRRPRSSWSTGTACGAVDAWKNMGLSVDADVVLLGRIDDRRAPAGEAAAERWSALLRGGRGRRWAARSTDAGGGRGAVRRPPAGLPGAGAARPGAHRGRLRAQGAACRRCSARIEAARRAARRADRQHRARRRRQPAPAAHHPARRRGRPGRARRPPSRDILADALALGGTVTGEHGVGLLKRAGLAPRARPPRWSPCTARSSRRSTRTASSTPARSSMPETRRVPVPGRSRWRSTCCPARPSRCSPCTG